MKLLIVEDETILLEKYQLYLSEIYHDIHTAENCYEASKLLKTNSYDVVLLDYNLPDGNGLELAKAIKSTNDESLLVMITAYSKERLVIDSLNLGVFKYLEKPLEKLKLIEIMKQTYTEAQKRNQTHRLIDQFLVNQRAKQRLKEEYFITDREIEVISLILVHGKNKNVSDELNLSQGTVRNHLSNIYQKLHITSKDELKSVIKKLNK
jgi:DNA-binding NarL/FixJ family response regulator